MSKAQYTHIALPATLVQQIVNYMQTRPYGEVAGYISVVESQGRGVTLDKPAAATEPKRNKTDGKSQAS